eukprot:4091978-Prymnesium_polylepis.1
MATEMTASCILRVILVVSTPAQRHARSLSPLANVWASKLAEPPSRGALLPGLVLADHEMGGVHETSWKPSILKRLKSP